MRPLTKKQLKFCHEYLKDGNGSRAYRDAGYEVKNENVSRTEASRLLMNPSVALFIKQNQEKQMKKNEITIDKIVDELVQTAFGSMEEIVKISEKGKIEIRKDANLKTLDGLSYTETRGEKSDTDSFSFKRADKVKALDMLCKLLGLYEKRDTESGRNLQANADRVLSALRRFKEKQ